MKKAAKPAQKPIKARTTKSAGAAREPPAKKRTSSRRGGVFTANIDVVYRDGVLDPQGQAVLSALHSLGFDGVQEVRVGKHFTLRVKARDRETAQKAVSEMCSQLLANPVLESYSLSLSE